MSDRYVTWRKSSKSNSGNGCVEVCTDVPGIVAIRDSKAGEGSAVLEFTEHEFECFKDGVLKGEF